MQFASLGLVAGMIGALASAGGVSERIYGGTPAAPCAWPNVVMIQTSTGVCSGTLIDPNIVVYAAHCGADVKDIYFGENVAQMSADGTFTLAQPTFTIGTPDCRVYPGHDPINGTDFAYCRLPTPIQRVPIVPILMGCEVQALVPNKTAVLVGFGRDEQGGVGRKKQAITQIDSLVPNKALVGKNGVDSCFGDSGGPAFVQLAPGDKGLTGVGDGSWRTVGVTSYSNSSACGSGTYFSLLATAVPWIESTSGLDITPCTDSAGNWMPGPNCGSFPANPDSTGGTWTELCSTDVLTGQSTTCGAPYVAGPPVHIEAPVAGAHLSSDTAFNVVASIPGAARTQALFDNKPVTLGGAAGDTYTFGPVKLASGAHTLAVTAWDAAGNSTTQAMQLSLADREGGCANAPAGLLPALLGLAAATRRGRRARVARIMALACVLACFFVACGTEGTALKVAGQRTSTTAVNPGPSPTQIPTPAPAPTYGAQIAGTVGGVAVPTLANYAYGSSGTHTELLVFASNQNAMCTLLANNADAANDQALMLTLLSLGNGVDQPNDGTFSIVDPNARLTASGNYATAVFKVNDANCANTLPDAVAKGGSLTLQTVISNSGSYIEVGLQGVDFGSGDVLNGSLVGQDCPLPDSIPAQATCNPAQ